MLIQLASSPGNIRPLVGHSFEIGRKLHRGNDATQVVRYRLKTEEQVNPVLINLFLELVDFLNISNGDRAEFVIPLKKAGNGAVETSFRQARHHEHIITERSKRLVEGSKNMSRCDHDEEEEKLNGISFKKSLAQSLTR